MGLIQTITNQIAKLLPKPVPSTSDEIVRPRATSFDEYAKLLQAAKSREERVRVCREMYDNDPRVKGVISQLASDTVQGGLVIEVTNSTEAQTVADELVKRLDLDQRLDDWLRLSLRDGDSFLERSIDDRRFIVAVTRKPTLEMNRNSDKRDLFTDPTRAFWQDDSPWGPSNNVIWYAAWQIGHVRWSHDEGSRYGMPQFAAAIKAHKRLDDGELNMAIKRKVHRGQILQHYVDGSWADVEAYKKNNTGVANNPIAEYFTNRPGNITATTANVQMGDIDDIEHHLQTWSTGTPVPLELLGYGANLNRDILEDKRAQYQDALGGVAKWTKIDMVRPLLELQWLLLGILPDRLDYTIKFGWEIEVEANTRQQSVDVTERRAEVIDRIAAAGAKLRLLYPIETVALIVARMLAEVDPELEPEELIRALPVQPDEINRMAGLLPLLSKNLEATNGNSKH